MESATGVGVGVRVRVGVAVVCLALAALPWLAVCECVLSLLTAKIGIHFRRVEAVASTEAATATATRQTVTEAENKVTSGK